MYSACIAAGLVWVGCAGAARPTWSASPEGSTYRGGRIAFTLPRAPGPWRSVTVTHATLAFRDDADSASIMLLARCTTPDQDTPLVALTNHLLIGTTERTIVSQEVEPFDAREALHTRAQAKLDGVPLAFELFVLKKDGCIYDFVRVAPPERSEDGADGPLAFRRFVRGFHTVVPR